MAFSEIIENVVKVYPDGRMFAVDGADVWIYEPGTQTEIAVFAADPDVVAGQVPLAQPLSSDRGRVDAWIESGFPFDLVASKVGVLAPGHSQPVRPLPGPPGLQGPPMNVQDEGLVLAQRDTLDFRGDGVDASDDGANVVVTIGRRNLAFDASFESGVTTGLIFANSTGVVSAEQAFDGKRSIKLTATASAATGLLMASAATNPAEPAPGRRPLVLPGQVYTASAYFRPTVTRDTRVLLYWYDSAGAPISTSDGPYISVPSNTWGRTSVTATAPSNAATGRLMAYAYGTLAGEVVYIDAWQLETGDSATAFVDDARPVQQGVAGAPGGVDDTTSFQNDLDDNAGRHLLVKAGVYKFSAGLTLASGTHLELAAGAVLDFTAAPASARLLEALGTEDAAVSLSTNAAVGASSLSMTSAASFAAGDLVRIGSTALFDPARDNVQIGELAEVLSTTASSVTLRSPLQGGPYNTANSAVISKVLPVRDVKISGPGTIRSTASLGQIGVKIDRAVNPRVRDVIFESVGLVAVQLVDCLDGVVDGVKVSHANFSTGYGVSLVNACQGCLVTNSHFRDCRHPTSTNAFLTRKGIARHIVISHCMAWDNVSATADAYDTHAACENISYLYNTIYDCSNAGFNIENPSATLIGNRIYRSAGRGIYLANYTAKPTEYVVRDNKIINPGSEGIQFNGDVAAGTGTVHRIIDISDNQVVNAPGIAIYLESSDAARPVRTPVVSGNTIRGCQAASGIAVFESDGPVITGNVVIDQLDTGSCIRLFNVRNGAITSNTLRCVALNEGIGVRMINTDDSTISTNTTMLTQVGVYIDAASTHNAVVANGLRTPVTGTIPVNNQGGATNVVASNTPAA